MIIPYNKVINRIIFKTLYGKKAGSLTAKFSQGPQQPERHCIHLITRSLKSEGEGEARNALRNIVIYGCY